MSVVYKPWAQNWFSIFYIDFNQKVFTILKILNIDCIVNEFFHHIYKSWSFKFHFREQQQENYIYIYTRRFNSEVENSDFLVRHIDVDLEYHAMFYAPYAASVSFFCQREGA